MKQASGSVKDESTMLAEEARIPELASFATRQAHQRALSGTFVIVRAQGGKLVQSSKNGTVRELKSLKASVPVTKGLRIARPKR